MRRPYFKLTDQELSTKFNNGDRAAYIEIYERYWPLMFNHALRLLQDQAEAEDAVQTVYSKLWEKRSTIKLDSTISSLLYQMVRNHILSLIRKEKTKINYLKYRVKSFELSPVDEQLIKKELVASLDAEIDLLPPKMKEIFLLRRSEEYTNRQIAELKSISEETVKRQVKNALKILRTKLTFLYNFLFI